MNKFFFIVTALLISVALFAGKQPPTPAMYPGGETAMQKYLHDSLRYPEVDRKNGIEGIVFVSFVVNAKGAVEEAKSTAIIGGSATLNAEAVRLVSSMPAWTPATSKGKATTTNKTVQVRFELPDSLIHFLNGKSDSITGEIMPEFMGGDPAMHMYLSMVIRYPKEEKEQEKEGTVFVRFTIQKNGKVSDVYSVKGVPGAPGLEKEAIRVVETFPRFKPGMANGNPVKVVLTIPVKFVLQ